MEFTFIGPEWGDDAEGGGDANGGGHGDDDEEKGKNGTAGNSGDGEEKKPKSATQLEGEEMVGELVAATEGLMCTMEVYLCIYAHNDLDESDTKLIVTHCIHKDKWQHYDVPKI